VAAGLFEAHPVPFVRGADSGFVRVSNPLAENEAHLRRAVLESLAQRAEYNLSRMTGSVRLFEIGSVFEPGSGELPAEFVHVGALVMGPRRPPHFTDPKPPAFDEWDAKGLGELIASAAFPGEETTLAPAAGNALWDIHLRGERVGTVRRVTLDAPPWASPAFGIEARLGAAPLDPAVAVADVAASHSPGPAFKPIPSTPAAELDVALLVPSGTMAADVERVIRGSTGDLLERLELFDEFTGAGVPEGYRSVAWRLTFRHPERTLRDKEVEGRRDKLLRTLENELGVRPRVV
jgi:phenylalanyl-tRNA synthetase beta chain